MRLLEEDDNSVEGREILNELLFVVFLDETAGEPEEAGLRWAFNEVMKATGIGKEHYLYIFRSRGFQREKILTKSGELHLHLWLKPKLVAIWEGFENQLRRSLPR